MNHRELNLHNIIKQQEAKISQLKQQLGLVTQLSQSHLIDTEKRTLDAVKEKEEIIKYLREELDVEKAKCKEVVQRVVDIQDVRIKNNQLEQQNKLLQQHNKLLQQSFKQQTQKLTLRNTQLQSRLQQLTESYEKKLTLLQRQNKRLTNESSTSINQAKLIQLQVEKLTKFYKSCIFEIPKRKETLLWVDNLIKYMEVWEQNSEKKYEELYNSVKEKINETRTECVKTVNETVGVEERLYGEAERVCAQMRKVLQQHRQNEKMMQTGIQQLHKLARKQKQSIQKTQLQTIRTQLTTQQSSHKQQKSKLQSKIKQLEQDKKTLVLGFQQIKTFLDNKETNYKQEISQLKNTINQLLEGNEMREKQFQEEIRVLSAQIEAISSRYYENIEYPVLKMNQRVERELNKVKKQLNRLGQQHVFKQQLDLLSQRLSRFTHSVEEQQQFVAIELCMKKGNELLISIRQLVAQMGQKRSDKRSSVSRKRQLSVYSVSGGGQKKKNHVSMLNQVKESVIKSSGNKRGSEERKDNKGNTSGNIRYSVVREQRGDGCNDGNAIIESGRKQGMSSNNNRRSQKGKSIERSPQSNKKPNLLQSVNISNKYTPGRQLSFNDSQPLFAPLSSSNTELLQQHPQQQQLPQHHQDLQHQQIQQLQHAVSQIQLKEKQSKFIYEMNVLKKHNQKLNQQIAMLEKKFKNLAANKFVDDKVIGNYFKVERRMIELDSENDKLRETNERYQALFKEEIQKLLKKMSEMQKQRKKASKQESSILQALGQLNERHQIIAEILTARNQKIKQLQTSTKIINKLLIRPQQTFQSMIKQFTTQLSTLTMLNNQQTQRTFPGGQFSSIAFSNMSHKSRLSINEGVIKEYQQMLNKRNEINTGVGRYITELIKTLRETFPVRQNKRRQTIDNTNKQNAANQLKPNPKLQPSSFEKKLKQLTTQQQKNKQQMSNKMDKLQQSLTSIDARQQKSCKLSQTRQKRFEQLLEKYMTQIIDGVKQVIEKEKKEQQGLNIQALKDTAGKLKQSIKENQGLKREMDVMYLFSKTSGNNKQLQQLTIGKNLQGENFYS